MSPQKEIVIIGAGAIGCSIAYHMAKLGVPSRIIEMDSVAAKASGRAWAVISAPARILLFFEGSAVPKGTVKPALGLFQEGLDRFPQLARELKEEGGIDIEHGQLPAISIISQESEAEALKKRLSELASQGYGGEWLKEDEVKARIPGINPEICGGVLFPGQQVEPYKYVLCLFQAAEKMGVEFKQGEVVGFRAKGAKVTSVKLASEEVEADIFVIAMGPWSGRGTSWLGKEIPMVVRREQCLKVEVARRLPAYRLLGNQAAIIPKVNGSVILGQTGAHHVVHEEITNFDDSPTEKAKIEILSAAVGLLPELEEAKLVEHRAGLEAWQPDGGIPMLGRVPDYDNVYIATWLATWGIQLSPAAGRVMAELIVRGHTESAIKDLSPTRFVK